VHSTPPPTTPDAAYLRLFVNPTTARTMIDASAMARRQGAPAPGYLGG
jgi:hypothetical protein